MLSFQLGNFWTSELLLGLRPQVILARAEIAEVSLARTNLVGVGLQTLVEIGQVASTRVLLNLLLLILLLTSASRIHGGRGLGLLSVLLRCLLHHGLLLVVGTTARHTADQSVSRRVTHTHTDTGGHTTGECATKATHSGATSHAGSCTSCAWTAAVVVMVNLLLGCCLSWRRWGRCSRSRGCRRSSTEKAATATRAT